jgi:leucyl/phenylalanyl-tRNA---protein transferase
VTVPDGSATRFPDPATAPADEPLAWGGDLRAETLLDAYDHGIFPWPTADGVPLWWSPDPRSVIPLDGLRVSRSLRRTLRSGRFRCATDTDFPEVVDACANRPGEGTWIVPELAAGYLELHELGRAHCVSVYDAADGALVGGALGITVGAAFTGESMFHRATDASKVALVHLCAHLLERGFTLLDAQLPTPHLSSLGAVEIPRARFLALLARARELDRRF